jgi:DNA (cytosine-5)-methyltransferase 1
MIYGSVCSGIGASEVAWQPLGWRCAFVSEIEKFPRAVLRHRLGAGSANGPALHGDFTTIEADEYEPIDILVGGTPCQSFSIAGLRGGLDDDRGNLALEYLRLAQRARPRWLVWENVPGVLSSNGGRDFGAILGGMGELGYGFAYRTIDAQFCRVDGFGRAVPQRRRRVFVVGYLGDWRRAAAVLFERQSLSGHPAPRRCAGEGASPTISSRPTGGGGLGTDFDRDGGLITSHDPACTLTAREYKGALPEADLSTIVAHSLRAEGFDASEDGTGRGTPLVPVACAQNTRDEVRLIDGDSGITGALAADPGMKQTTYVATPVAFHNRQDPDVSGDVTHPLGAKDNGMGVAIAFSAKDHGGDATEGVSPTLRAGGHTGSHANAGVMPAVAFQERGRAGGRNLEIGGNVAFALTAPSGGGRAQERNIATPYAVRRLTPRECERLQGFPDHYTEIPWRGKAAEDCPDGPRYKALGNAMAVNCMRWLGQRIEKVEAICGVEKPSHD